MARMTGGQALVESLKREGIDTVFGLPGVQLDWAFDALYENRDQITVYHTRHEQATSYMADGYARTTGKVGACLVVPGPGLLNAAAGLSTAYACSSPVLCIAGQIQSDLIGAGRGLLHEIKDQLEMIGSVTKWAGRAMSPGEVPGIVREAFRQLRTGRPRPVEIEIPPDVLQAEAEVQLANPARPERAAGDPDLLRQAAEALRNARRPMIFVGGGILAAEAWDELRQLAETLQAPVVISRNGRGALEQRRVAGGLIGRQRAAQLDVGLGLEHVGRDLDLHRAGAAGAQLAEGLVHDQRHLVGAGGAGVPLGDVAQHAQLVVDLVQHPAADIDQVRIDLAGDAQDRGVDGVGGGEGTGGVKHARSGDDDEGALASGGAGVAIGHVAGGLLVAGVQDADAVLGGVERVEGVVQLHAGEAEDGLHPLPDERLDQRLPACHERHKTS